MKKFTSNGVAKLQAAHNLGRLEAARLLKKEVLVDRVNRAVTVEDLKKVLLVMLDSESVADL